MIGRIRRQKGSSGKNRLRFKSFFAEILKTLKKYSQIVRIGWTAI